MSMFLRVALWIFVPSVLIVLTYVGLDLAYPNLLSGTNIGGGALVLLAYIGILTSGGFFIAAIVEKRQKGSK